jgi:DNA invertase Pin-like site-specific DNA recombinase
MGTHRIGYGRISTSDQNASSQEDALSRAGVDRLFIDTFTGTKASRPELDKAREQLREGDVLIITRLDRLGRSTKDLLTIVGDLE